MTISVEDGTGACDLKFWMSDDGEDDPRMAGIASVPLLTLVLSQAHVLTCDSGLSSNSQDVYVRVIGTIKDFGNRRHLAASQVRPITDHNEIFFHLLEAQYVHLLLRRGKPVRPSLLRSLQVYLGVDADVQGVVNDDSTTTRVSALEEVSREGTPETTAWVVEEMVEEVEACTTISSRSSRFILPFVSHPCARQARGRLS